MTFPNEDYPDFVATRGGGGGETVAKFLVPDWGGGGIVGSGIGL